jgi:creatinine amidohydrolase
MRLRIVALVLALFPGSFASSPQRQSAKAEPVAPHRDSAKAEGQRLEDLAWPEAERVFTPQAIVVVPLGAASKEHGPHLKLKNDLTLAEYLTRRVISASPVVVAPTLTYHYYPAFLEYPGSTSLALNTARDMTADVVRSLARYGPRRFYVLNTGISTIRALDPAAKMLASEGVLMRYTNLGERLGPVTRSVGQQERGSHADEIETSMMLYIDPASVDMGRAVKDAGPDVAPFNLTRQNNGRGTYSPTGIWGDPTLATVQKGRTITEALVAGILEDIKDLAAAPLPAGSPTPQPVPPPEPPPASTSRPDATERCSAGDERAIRAIGDAYTTHWNNGDAMRLASLWAPDGDMTHPDGLIERGPLTLMQNRAALFQRRDYRNTRHPMTLSIIRCLSRDIAVADGKWELRGVLDASGKPSPTLEGLVTLVVKRYPRGWLIEAYRYSVKPLAGQVVPTLLKRPGFPG